MSTDSIDKNEAETVGYNFELEDISICMTRNKERQRNKWQVMSVVNDMWH